MGEKIQTTNFNLDLTYKEYATILNKCADLQISVNEYLKRALIMHAEDLEKEFKINKYIK